MNNFLITTFDKRLFHETPLHIAVVRSIREHRAFWHEGTTHIDAPIIPCSPRALAVFGSSDPVTNYQFIVIRLNIPLYK